MKKIGRTWRRWEPSTIYCKYFKWFLLMPNANQWQDFLIRTKSGFRNKRILFKKPFGSLKECIIAYSISELVIPFINYTASKSFRKQVS